MTKLRIGNEESKRNPKVNTTGGNNVEVTADADVSNLDHETGGATGDWDSNVSAEAGNPNGRGAGNDPGPLTHETDRHDSQSRDEQIREQLIKERRSLPDTGARRGDLDAPIADRGGSYSPSNNGHRQGRH